MNNCIFAPHCISPLCDKACGTLVESSYLLERNNITINNEVYNSKDLKRAIDLLHKSSGKFASIISDNTVSMSNLLTYCAICENWHGNRLHCSVYNLKFSNYIDLVQRSWSLKDAPELLEYEQIWYETSKILIISNIDYVQFKDFQAQTLLNIFHSRQNRGLTTIVVSPKLQTLVGSGAFYNRLQSILKEAVIK